MTDTLTTPEARAYIENAIGKKVHQPDLPRWRRIGWIERHTIGFDGKPNTYTIAALDELCRKINTRHRKSKNE